jgi:hypothetical protein
MWTGIVLMPFPIWIGSKIEILFRFRMGHLNDADQQH